MWHVPEEAQPLQPHPQLPQELEQLCLPWRRLWIPLAMMATQTAAMMRPMMISAMVNSSFRGVAGADGSAVHPRDRYVT